MIEDEVTHWYNDSDGKSHRSSLRIETSPPSNSDSGYPKDGLITLRLSNTIGSIGFRMNPDEALRVGTLLLSVAKEQVNRKRSLWNAKDE